MTLVKNIAQSPQFSLATDLNLITLNNGLTIVHQHLPHSNVVATDIWINAGVITESEHESGMSHFLEHMIFKGTKNILPGEFDYIVESKGGYTNAATSYDYTHFFLTCASDYCQQTLPYLTQMILGAQIADEHFELERDVVLEELRSTHDDHDWTIFQTLIANIYPTHPYGKSVLGDEEYLLRHSPDSMRRYHQNFYHPENMSLVMVGDIEKQEAIDLAEQCFSDHYNPPTICPIKFDCEAPLIEIRRQQLFLPRLEQPRLVMGWMTGGVEDVEGAIALDMLSVVLTGGRSARLTYQMREEEQLVMDISCDFSLQKHSSLFTITVYSCTDNLAQVEERLIAEINRLRNEPISEKELKTCQKSLYHDYIFSTETSEQLASLYGYYQNLDRANLAFLYPKVLNNLTVYQLQQYARQYLSTEYYAICYAYPQ